MTSSVCSSFVAVGIFYHEEYTPKKIEECNNKQKKNDGIKDNINDPIEKTRNFHASLD